MATNDRRKRNAFSLMRLLLFSVFFCSLFLGAFVVWISVSVSSSQRELQFVLAVRFSPDFFLKKLSFCFSAFLPLSCGEDGGVDVVYTWVNGSRLAGKNLGEEEGRFRDYDVLRFSLRSVRAFFPALRLVHVVVADDEIPPLWLNVANEQLRLVRHSQILPRASLPTFNSNAIEANLHLIPHLSSCFLYLNDDMLLGRANELSHFWDAARGRQKVHFGVWRAPMPQSVSENSAWHRAVARTNAALDRAFGANEQRRYPLHGCYFFHKTIFAEMRRTLRKEFERTMATPLRSEEDVVVSFAYPHFAVNKFGA